MSWSALITVIFKKNLTYVFLCFRKRRNACLKELHYRKTNVFTDINDFMRRRLFFLMMLIAGSEKIRKCSSDVLRFVTYFCSSNQNGVDLGKWLPVLCAPPHTTEQRRRGGEVSHVYGKCSDLGSLRFQLMTLQLKLRNDKIPKNNLIAAIHQQRNTGQERICEKEKEQLT